jgi:para-aminobenzoate synthetase/4-amino-4-deoxychorismate lyase
VNHTLRLRARADDDPRGRYRDLCFAQRGAFAAYLDTGAHRVLSASPELFFRLDGDTITTRPMKGTALRGRWLAEDDAIRERLERSVKDRAENAMIVDLLRNDLGRVARRGTVRWDDAFEAERYETVWQLTTTVAATLRPDAADLPTIFAALFPSGSVTGAPKVATMRLIGALEDSPRGVYCGAVGFLAPPGSPGPRARFNVAIRTIVEDAATGLAEYGVGGGITWDSSAGAEYDETVAKAQVLTVRRPPFRLLETLAHDPAEGFRRLEHHLDRLRSSAAYFGFAYDEDAVRSSLDAEAARFDGPARIRLLLDRRGRIETGGVPLTTPPGPLRLALDEGHPVDPDDVALFHKTTLRARYDEAIARHPGADDVILVNAGGEVTETTRANLAVRREGRWWTPPREAGLLAGCEREALLVDGTLAEATISVDDLRGAEDLAFVNSVRGWIPAVLADVAERR